MNATIKTLRAACALLIGMVVFNCSDANPSIQTPEKEAVGKTNDGKDVVVFDRGDLDEVLFKIDTVYITDSSFLGKLYFRNLAESKIPEPGDIIASSITKIAPYGFLYRVTEVNREGEDVTVVSVIYASIAEAVEEADIEIVIPFGYSNEELEAQVLQKSLWGKIKSVASSAKNFVVGVAETVYEKGVVFVKATSGTFDGDKDYTIGKFSVDNELSFSSSSGNAKLSGSVKLKGSYDLFFTAKIKIKHYVLKNAEISITQDAYMKLIGNLKGDLKYSENFKLAEEWLAPITFVVVFLPVVITNKITIKAKVETSAQVNLNAELGFRSFSKFGFGYDGSFHRINICENTPEFGYNYSAHGDIRLGLLLGLESMLYGLAGLEVTAGPSLVLKQELPLSAKSSTKLHSDLDINVTGKIDIAGIYHRAIDFDAISPRISLGDLFTSKTFPSFNFKLPDMKSPDGKLSFPFEIIKEKLGFSFLESGFCIEDKAGDCIKGPGFGKLGNIVGSNVNFEGLDIGKEYGIVPFFRDLDGEYHYLDAVKFVYGLLNSSSSLASSSSGGIVRGSPVTHCGETYETVVIGTQTWMNRNLNCNVDGSRCYGDDPANCAIYGRLYDWTAATALSADCNTTACASQITEKHRGICPAGWHISNDAEWDVLMKFVNPGCADNSTCAGTGTKLKAKSGWNIVGTGTDDFGFAALPGGYRSLDVDFTMIGDGGYWWSSTENDASRAYYRIMVSYSDDVNRVGNSKNSLRSVRCIKD